MLWIKYVSDPGSDEVSPIDPKNISSSNPPFDMYFYCDNQVRSKAMHTRWLFEDLKGVFNNFKNRSKRSCTAYFGGSHYSLVVDGDTPNKLLMKKPDKNVIGFQPSSNAETSLDLMFDNLVDQIWGVFVKYYKDKTLL